MSFEDFIDEEVIELANELENPKKYHYEEHSDDTIHFYEDGEEIIYDEVVDLLNEQEETIQKIHSTLDNRIEKLKESIENLKEMDNEDLNPQAVEDVALVLSISLNALKEFKKELIGDVE